MNFTRTCAALLLSGVVWASAAPLAAQTPPAQTEAPCARAERRALDFWLGEWDLTWQGGAAASRVVKTLDGCAIEETFQSSAGIELKGRSLTSYDADTRRWRQAWSDNQGGSVMLSGGPYGRDFILYKLRFSNEDPYQRALFEDVTPDAFTWRWQRSGDGKAWEDVWVVNYVRRATANSGQR